jgi:hypothetical protein
VDRGLLEDASRRGESESLHVVLRVWSGAGGFVGGGHAVVLGAAAARRSCGNGGLTGVWYAEAANQAGKAR